MAYKYCQIRDQIVKEVKRACFSPDNYYSDTVWNYHILEVFKHSVRLGRKLKADIEVVELAAYLHDYSVLIDVKYEDEHHVHSARLAGELLRKFGYPENKIKMIKEAIVCHRGSKDVPRRTKEAKVLASADAMSHFTQLADMFYLAYNIHGYKTCKGAIWLEAKLGRSWKKIIPAGKKMIKKDHEIAKNILNIAKKSI